MAPSDGTYDFLDERTIDVQHASAESLIEQSIEDHNELLQLFMTALLEERPGLVC